MRKAASRTADGNPAQFVWAMPLVLFVLSRTVYFAAGVRFDAEPVLFFAQLLDVPLLRDRLLESLWYLHAQPPLYNLLTGVALKVASGSYPELLRGVFLTAGLAGYYALFDILRLLGMRRGYALAAATILCCSPTYVIYENWYFYPYLVNVLIMAVCWSLLRGRGSSLLWFAVTFGFLMLLVLLRSTYHPVFYLVLAVFFILPLKEIRRRRVAMIAGICFVPVLALVLKNLVLFGFIGTSSWGGNSLHKVACYHTQEEIPALIESGELHRISALWQFSHPSVYMRALGVERETGIPALDETEKSLPSENPVNYNHWVYPLVSEIYLGDAMDLIRRYPAKYVAGVWTALGIYLMPTTEGMFVDKNRQRIFPAAKASEWVESNVATVILTILGLGLAVWRVGMSGTLPGERLFWMMVVMTCLWTTVLSNAVEIGENNRMRFEVLGMQAILVVLSLRFLGRLSLEKWRARANAKSLSQRG